MRVLGTLVLGDAPAETEVAAQAGLPPPPTSGGGIVIQLAGREEDVARLRSEIESSDETGEVVVDLACDQRLLALARAAAGRGRAVVLRIVDVDGR